MILHICQYWTMCHYVYVFLFSLNEIYFFSRNILNALLPLFLLDNMLVHINHGHLFVWKLICYRFHAVNHLSNWLRCNPKCVDFLKDTRLSHLEFIWSLRSRQKQWIRLNSNSNNIKHIRFIYQLYFYMNLEFLNHWFFFALTKFRFQFHLRIFFVPKTGINKMHFH